jgi:hypothetical protein
MLVIALNDDEPFDLKNYTVPLPARAIMRMACLGDEVNEGAA